jgi:hypothetical protein
MTHSTTNFATSIGEKIDGSSPAFVEFQTNAVHRYMELGTDPASAAGGVTGVLFGLVQKEALTRGLAETFLLSAIPAMLALVFVFFMIRRKKAASASAPGDAQQHVMIEM